MTVTVGLDREHALVHERRDVVGHDARRKAQARGDVDRRVEREAAGEDRAATRASVARPG